MVLYYFSDDFKADPSEAFCSTSTEAEVVIQLTALASFVAIDNNKKSLVHK